MSKVQFKHNQYGIEEFAEYYRDNTNEIFELGQIVKSKYRCGELYCDLSNGFWDEEKLGEFRGDLFACVFTKYLFFTTSPYAMLKYSACHNPQLEKNITEEEFDKMMFEEIFNDYYMSTHQDYMRIFFEEASRNTKANQSRINILRIVDDE